MWIRAIVAAFPIAITSNRHVYGISCPVIVRVVNSIMSPVSLWVAVCSTVQLEIHLRGQTNISHEFILNSEMDLTPFDLDRGHWERHKRFCKQSGKM